MQLSQLQGSKAVREKLDDVEVRDLYDSERRLVEGLVSESMLTTDQIAPHDSRFYFVHSYRVVPTSDADVLATTRYGVPFASMIRAGNVMGAQYHPEKSHAFGMQILRNFASL